MRDYFKDAAVDFLSLLSHALKPIKFLKLISYVKDDENCITLFSFIAFENNDDNSCYSPEAAKSQSYNDSKDLLLDIQYKIYMRCGNPVKSAKKLC